MGRKPKNTFKEDKVSNGFTEAKEKLHLHYQNSNAMNVENNVNSKATSVVVRRSKRLKNCASPDENLGVEVENVDLVQNENEGENEACNDKVGNVEREPLVEQESTLQEVNDISSLEKKVDYLIRAVDEFKAKFARDDYGRSNDGSSPNISYKGLYFESQKKIEALIEENFELVKKVEFACGKNAAYEAMKDVMGAWKEVILVSALGKATENTAANLSPLPVQNHSSCPLPPPTAKNTYRKKKA